MLLKLKTYFYLFNLISSITLKTKLKTKYEFIYFTSTTLLSELGCPRLMKNILKYMN